MPSPIMDLETGDGIIYANWILKKILHKPVCYIYKLYIVLKSANVTELKSVNAEVKVSMATVTNPYCM